MKILHIQQYFNDGYGYQENIFPAYHEKLGHEVIMITSTKSDGHNDENRTKQEGSYIERGFHVKRIPIVGEFKHRFVVFKNLLFELEEYQPDYIYHHSSTAISILTAVKYKKKNPTIFLALDNHADLQISGRNRLWKKFYYNLIWKTLLKKQDKYIDVYFGVTPNRCKFLSEELGVDPKKVKLLPIGADTDYITSIKDKLPSQHSEKVIFCHGGKMSYAKQTDRLIEAFKACDNQNIELKLFGSFYDSNLKELIEDDDRIEYLGWLNREDTLKLLLTSDVGIWNNQHTTLLEDAVGCELPIVLKKYGSTEHLIQDNGLFLLDDSIDAIKDKIIFFSDKKNVKKYKQQAIVMSSKLSYDEIAKLSLRGVEENVKR